MKDKIFFCFVYYTAILNLINCSHNIQHSDELVHLFIKCDIKSLKLTHEYQRLAKILFDRKYFRFTLCSFDLYIDSQVTLLSSNWKFDYIRYKKMILHNFNTLPQFNFSFRTYNHFISLNRIHLKIADLKITDIQVLSLFQKLNNLFEEIHNINVYMKNINLQLDDLYNESKKSKCNYVAIKYIKNQDKERYKILNILKKAFRKYSKFKKIYDFHEKIIIDTLFK
ncbi:hypothetical protein H311_00474 [Anncaliia algerae PRA109]|nr:hypothetical protein H311_00474 [Anncaliia algerae PRA109]